MPDRQVDHYEVLGIERGASAAEIRAAYLKLVKRYHPDVGGDESSDEMMAALNEAHDQLRDAAARAEYDRGLRERSTRAPDPGDEPLYVDVVLEKIDTGRARRKLATLNREFVRMEEAGWHVEFRHDHLVCTKGELAPPNDALFLGSVAAAILAAIFIGGLFLEDQVVNVLIAVIGIGAVVAYMGDRERRKRSRPERLTISIDPDGNPRVTVQPR